MNKKSRNFSVTILISAYNQASSLEECFRSIHDQSFQDFKIVCINDGSTDLTDQTIEKWKNIFGEDRFILNINKYNLGLTRSLNIGLLMINTPYTARIDADDVWHPKKLEKQIKFLLKNDEYGIIGCFYSNLLDTKETKIKRPVTDEEIKNKMSEINPFAHSCVVFNTALIKSVNGYAESLYYGQDYDLWLKCFKKTKFYNIPEFLCKRKIAGKSYVKTKAHLIGNLSIRFNSIKKYHLPFYCFLPLFRDTILFSLIIIINKIKSVLRINK